MLARIARGASVLALLVLCLPSLRAEEYKGAAAALKQIEARNKVDKDQKDPLDPATPFREKLTAFKAKVATLPAKEAAAGWLALVEQFAKVNPNLAAQTGNPLQFTEVIGALPPPADWADLQTAVETRYPATAKRSSSAWAMLLLVHTLNGRSAEQSKDAAGLRGHLAQANAAEKQFLTQQVLGVLETLGRQSRDPARVAEAVELKITAGGFGQPWWVLDLPDLVTLVGPAKAETLLRKALLQPAVEVRINSGDATKALARKLALQLIAQLKSPQWSVAQTPDSMALFEAMEKRFPTPVKPQAGRPGFDRWGGQRPDEQSHELARAYYMLGLIIAGRTPQAIVQAKHFTGGQQNGGMNYYYLTQALNALDQAGHTAAMTKFFREALAKDPTLPFWDMYIESASKEGDSAKVVAEIKAALARPTLKPEVQVSLRQHLYKALLSADMIDEGVAALRQLISSRSPAQRMAVREDRAGLGVQLARIGHLLGRADWREEGIQVAIRAGNESAPNEGYGSTPQELVQLLIELKRGPEAEKVLLEHLNRELALQQPGQPIQVGAETLVELAGLYHQAGRHADVLTLLDNAPNWGQPDLRGIMFKEDGSGTPLGQMAAIALAKAGRKQEAIRINEALLRHTGGYDPAYTLLLELRGEAALPLLDALYAGDRFEERPLIWKAELLKRMGKLEEAETVVKQAISVDPSDGDQHHGDRLRAYALLGEIRAARGDQVQAAHLAEAIKAIRIAEKADLYYAAGLLPRGIKLYSEALTHFSDAYCIQSRLAVQLASEGKFEEAAAHYQRAYELMPDSFGRMETHCFGCEGVFMGKRAQGVAEKVFTQLLAKTPNKPQVHYLMGYLRSAQGRFPDALKYFREAVKLDPDYLNAWEQIRDVSGHIELPPDEVDAATFNVLRLDPQGRHITLNVADVHDLKKLWTEVEAARQHQTARPKEPLYTLAASKKAQEKIEEQQRAQGIPGGMMRRNRWGGFVMGNDDEDDEEYSPYGHRRGRLLPPPAEVIAMTGLVAASSQILDTDLQRRFQGAEEQEAQ